MKVTRTSLHSTFRLLARGLLLLGLLGVATSANAWWNHDWSFRKQINLDGTSKGANVQGSLDNAVVLVRLSDKAIQFTDANADGSDLRFVAEDDKTPLKFHVEKFDNVFNLGYVWVQVPKLAGDKPQSIYMYYGNSKATPGSEPGETYGSNQMLVYHFAERGSPASDSSSNKSNATTPFSVDESGWIGNAAKFDGTAVMPVPATPGLAIKAGESITWSAWIKPAAAGSTAIIYARHDATGSFVVGLNAGIPYVGLADGGAGVTPVQGAAALDVNWHHIAVVAAPTQTTLFIDGAQAGVLPRGIPALNSMASLGGDGGIAGQPIAQGFHGEVDELEIAREARSAGWVALAASNQGAADKLVTFGGDEQQSSFSTGYVGIILHSVTADGWVVIGILIVMMVISFGIMFNKGRQIGRASRANNAFLEAFEEAARDFAVLHRATASPETSELKLDDDVLDLIQDAPLFRLFNAGVEELHQRLEKSRNAGKGELLTEQAIEAIRASLSAKLVRETQILNRRMVLLTIAISGGPFIGLLGTVVGVMITFAAVAAAGDVNVNAIAPGIAAALAATVAGLFVAIPSLFGYNYLISQTKECSIEMNAFLEAFITGMAEHYDEPGTLHAMSD